MTPITHVLPSLPQRWTPSTRLFPAITPYCNLRTSVPFCCLCRVKNGDPMPHTCIKLSLLPLYPGWPPLLSYFLIPLLLLLKRTFSGYTKPEALQCACLRLWSCRDTSYDAARKRWRKEPYLATPGSERTGWKMLHLEVGASDCWR